MSASNQFGGGPPPPPAPTKVGMGGAPPPPPPAGPKKTVSVALPPPMPPAPTVIGGGPIPPPMVWKAPSPASGGPPAVVATPTTKKIPSVLLRKTPEQIAEEEYKALLATMETEKPPASHYTPPPKAPLKKPSSAASSLPPPIPVQASAAPSDASSNFDPPPVPKAPYRAPAAPSTSNVAPPPMAKRFNVVGSLANRKTPEQQAAEEMEAMLLEASEPAPRRGGVVVEAPPVEVIHESYAPPPKKYTSYGRQIFDDEAEERVKREAPFAPLPRGYTSKYTVPSNIPKSQIIATANDAYIRAIYENFRNVQFLENAIDEDWENFLVVEWDNILGDPIFLERYGDDPSKIMGRLESTRTTQGFETSMDTFSDTMRAPCSRSGTPERNMVASVRRFVITYDSSLPDSIIPNFHWDSTNKILTTIHNSYSLVDGLYEIHWKSVNGNYFNWFVPMYWTMTGGKGPAPEIADFRSHSTMGHAVWEPRTTKKKTTCFFCKGTGRKGPFPCTWCEGTGVR